ncbi:MAG: helix-turn-helix transcriptional regulator [Rhodomicrobium sp.]|nr:helix-turn-helix transcriptional regulator [Rhodomicrobium sp.]
MDEAMYKTLCAALDELAVAVFILSPDSKVLFANQAGKAMLTDGWPVRCSDGCLHGKDREVSEELACALEAVLQSGEQGQPETGDYEICLAHSLEEKPGAIGYLRGMRPSEDAEPVVALFVTRSGDGGLYSVAALAESFELSKAETKVLKQLIEAHTPAAVAARLNVSIFTVKSHMRKIFQKTNTSGQADLLRLVECFRIPLRSVRSAKDPARE